MNASPLLSLRLLLSPLVMAAVLAAPSAFAKKDLFATEPGAKNAPAAQQLAPASSAVSEESQADTKIQNDAAKSDNANTNPAPATNTETKKETQKEPSAQELLAQKDASLKKESSTSKEPSTQKDASTSKEPDAKEPSAIEVQLARLKRNLTKTKNDLFGNKDSSDKKAAKTPAIEPQLADSTPAEDEAKSEVATISTTEAAQRAQTFAEGQVINVRKYYEEAQPRYAVKLLQKNGRMKTINLDAVNGTLIEETPQ